MAKPTPRKRVAKKKKTVRSKRRTKKVSLEEMVNCIVRKFDRSRKRDKLPPLTARQIAKLKKTLSGYKSGRIDMATAIVVLLDLQGLRLVRGRT